MTESTPEPESKPAGGLTFDDLVRRKPLRTESLALALPDGLAGKIVVRALPGTAYDALVAQHQPTAEQKAKGFDVDLDAFQPALWAACSVSPRLTLDQAEQVWRSDQWSRGDLQSIWDLLLTVNNARLSVPFTAAG